jgi:hypothetical protein
MIGHHKCREIWPNVGYERGYTILLDVLLLLAPLLVLLGTYLMIARTLWTGIKDPGTIFKTGLSEFVCFFFKPSFSISYVSHSPSLLPL